jgi:AraC-like DNA-binding protein
MKVTAAPATLSMAYLAALLHAIGIARADAIELFKQTGLAPALMDEPTARITEHEFSTIYRLLAIQLDDEMLQLFTRAFRPGALKFTCLTLLDAKNLMVALHRWSQVSRLLREDFHIELGSDTTSARIALICAQEPSSPCQPLAMDLMLKVIHGVASWLVGKRLPLRRVDFPFERPAHAADYQVLYPGPVFFNQPVAALHFDAELLHLPIRRGRHELNEFLLRAPEDWIFVSREEERLSQRLRSYLTERLPLPATAETAAEALQVSTRTLHRRLADEGTSFQRVKDEFRRDMAVQMLTKSHAPITSISAQLGFDSTASFHRAFRGWTGDTPGAFRGSGPTTR